VLKIPFAPSKPRQLTKKTIKATSPSLEANNRKIRKIELATAGFSGYSVSSGSNHVSTDEDASWSSNDNWLVRKTLDNVKGFFGKKPTSFKKTHGQKHPSYHWTVSPKGTSTTSPVSSSTSTTTAAPPAKLPAVLSLASTELLNLDIGNAASAYEDADHELLLMLTTKEGTTSTSTTPVPSTTAPSSTTDPSTTELPSSVSTASEDSTSEPEETTDPPTTSFDSSTTVATPTPSSTTEAEELNSQTTGSESTTTVASDELATTTLNADYTVDESFSESSGQTSIYGLDKNSLIMRLLRARSNQNVLI